MSEKLKLVKINSEYCDYLRKFDKRVPYNFDKKMNRPFVGVLFKVGDYKYFAPLSSPKEKHLKMKNIIDFLRLDGGKLGAINFNNMIPVKNDNITLIDLKQDFNIISDEKYKKLLQNQIFWLNRNAEKIYYKAYKIYEKYVSNNLDNKIADRCCNFKLLEQKCNEYRDFMYS